MGATDWLKARVTEWVDARLDRDFRTKFRALPTRQNEYGFDPFGFNRDDAKLGALVTQFFYKYYFRVEAFGVERVPPGRVLLVANHSGLLPYDGLMLAHGVEREHESGERPRFLVADWLVTLPFVQPALARLGGVRACRENAERLLRSGRFVIAFPEGEKGAAKVFRERYRLKRFGRGGVVRLALASRAPLVPVGIVGAEEAHPILFKAHTAARAVGLRLGKQLHG